MAMPVRSNAVSSRDGATQFAKIARLEGDRIVTQISPMLAVNDGTAAIKFYKAAFGATVLWYLGNDHVVAGLSINGAEFFLATESPEYGTRGPSSAGFTTVRIELFVDDPVATHQQALAAGAVEHSPVREHTHETIGPRPIKRMLQGAVADPFGHLWLIGKILA
jgi:PhnB protein